MGTRRKGVKVSGTFPSRPLMRSRAIASASKTQGATGYKVTLDLEGNVDRRCNGKVELFRVVC